MPVDIRHCHHWNKTSYLYSITDATTIRKTKALLSRAVTSAYAKHKASHDAAHSLVLVIEHSDIETND